MSTSPTAAWKLKETAVGDSDMCMHHIYHSLATSFHGTAGRWQVVSDSGPHQRIKSDAIDEIWWASGSR